MAELLIGTISHYYSKTHGSTDDSVRYRWHPGSVRNGSLCHARLHRKQGKAMTFQLFRRSLSMHGSSVCLARTRPPVESTHRQPRGELKHPQAGEYNGYAALSP